MRHSKALQKLRAGQPVKLAYLGHLVPLFVAHAAKNGYDAIWLDMEHRTWTTREIQSLLPLFHLYDIDCIIRTPTREKTALYRFLEDGATGFIVPLIASVEEAEEIVQRVKFPPLGDRGLEGKGLDANFGLDTATPNDKQAFIEHANRETIVVIQLESPAAIAQAKAIAAVEGVDVLFAGPTDFGIRAPHSPLDMTWPDALQTIHEGAQAHGKAWGVMPRNADQTRDYYERGARFIPHGLDVALLINGLKQASDELDDIYG